MVGVKREIEEADIRKMTSFESFEVRPLDVSGFREEGKSKASLQEIKIVCFFGAEKKVFVPACA